jgi:HEAT repeat protein
VLAPSSPELSEVLREARKDSDPSMVIVAQGRLGREGDAAEQKAARDALLELGKSDDAEADRALVELAGLGDARAVEPLVKALARERSFARVYAARGLVNLGALTRAARLLGDREPEVRLDVACAVLAHD